jgi:hypothetical protein
MSISKKVKDIFFDSLYTDKEDPGNGTAPEGAVIVDSIRGPYGFHPERLKSHEAEVREVLSQMPIPFHKDSGGGWSFLNLCQTKNGEQWGEHENVEQLVCLGIGLGLVSYCMPREFWVSLPGGMPYVMISL